MNRLPDAATRHTAAHVFDRNLVVTAGAGTGKTSLLVERAVNLVLTDTAAIDTLVIMTFTKKAAAELRERIGEAFIEIVEAVDPRIARDPHPDREAARCLPWLRGELKLTDDLLHDRAEHALHRLDNASVGTIHGFASDILRRHPVEAGLPPEFTPDEGEERVLLFERIWPDFLARELGARGKAPELWRSTLSQFRLEKIGELARELINSPHVLDHLQRHEYEEQTLDEAARADIAELIERLPEHVAILEAGKSPHRQASLQLEMLPLLLEGKYAEIQDAFTRTNEALVAAGKNRLGDTFWKNGYKVPKAQADRVGDDLDRAAKHLRPAVKVTRRDLVPLMGVLRRFAREFDREAARAGMPAMDDLLLRARNVLRDHQAVRRMEAARARTLLLDEFQDTDPLQYEIAFLLAGEDPGGVVDDPYALPPGRGRLFIVGDPKQSIYRFRGADIVAYNRAVAHIDSHGGEVHDLTTNFRSRPGLVEPINRLFQDWMSKDDETGADVSYKPITAHRPAGDGPAVETISIPVDREARVGRRRDVEADVVADRVRAEIESGVRPQDIALLFRAMTRAPVYTRALRERGIHFIVEGGKSFAERPEVVEALGLLRALANPADPVATLAALRGSFGGVTDPELAAFAAAGGVFSWNRPSADEAFVDHPAVIDVFRRLRKLDKETGRRPTDRRIHAVLLESDFGLLQASFFEGAQRIANVRKLAERAAAVARNRRLGLDATMQAVTDDLQGDSKEWESPLADEQVEAVRVLTVHKAKGLEFPIVIMPDLPGSSGGGNRQPHALSVCRRDGRVFVGVRTEYKDNMALTLKKIGEGEHEKAEMKRILYVALTRAKERLVIVNNDPKSRSAWVKQMQAAWEYAHREGPAPDELLLENAVLDRAPGRPDEFEAPVRPAPEGVDEAVTGFEEARTEWEAYERGRSRTPSSDERASRAERDSGDDAPAALPPGLAALVGTAIHNALETWDFTDETAVRNAVATASGNVAEAPWSADQVREGAKGILDGLLASDLPAYLRGVEILAREAPILYRDEAGATVHGYADLVYRRDGRVCVADYKSKDPKGRAGAEAEKFRSQLTDYAVAVQRAWNLPELPAREVVFLPTGERVALPDEAPPAESGDPGAQLGLFS